LRTVTGEHGKLMGRQWIITEEPKGGFSESTDKPKKGKPTNQKSGSRLYSNNEKDSNNELTTTNENIDVAVFDPEVNALIVESFEFKADEVNRGTVAIPPAPRRFDPFDIDTASEELKENHFSAENFARITGTPAAQMLARFSSEVEDFVLEQKGRKTVYNRFDEFSGHFFNWSRSRVRARSMSGASTKQAPPANYQTSTRY